MNRSLKTRIQDYWDSIGEFDEEEFANAEEILDEYDENLSGLNEYDSMVILRLIDDDDLHSDIISLVIKLEI